MTKYKILHTLKKYYNDEENYDDDENYDNEKYYDDEENYDNDENYDDKAERRLACRLKCLGARPRGKAMQTWLDIKSN